VTPPPIRKWVPQNTGTGLYQLTVANGTVDLRTGTLGCAPGPRRPPHPALIR
jgi:hypothetical protein